MPKESTIQHYTSSTTGNAPAGVDLASGELAINTADEKIFYKNHVGTVLSLSQTKDLSGAFAPRSGVVTSINGATGNIVSIATTGSNVFTGLNTFNTGLSAANLFVSGGATFGTSVSISGGTAWHANNDGKGSGLDTDLIQGIPGVLFSSNLATGLLYGGLLSINGSDPSKFDITAGKGQIHFAGASHTSEPNPTLNFITWAGATGVTLTGLTSQDTTWLYYDSAGVLHQQATYYTDDQIENNIAIGALVHPNRTSISLARSIPNVAYTTDKQYEQFIRAFGPIKVGGHTIQANGANLKLNRTSGTVFILGRNYSNDPNNPSVMSDNAQTDCTFWRYYRGATAGSFVTVLNQTDIDPENYDDGTGTLNTVPSNKPFTIQRLFFFPKTTSVLGVYYGRGVYASISEAANNINFEDFTEITNTATNAVFVGYLLVKKGTTDLTAAIAADDARIIQSGQFRSTTSGGGTISTNLDSLNDVIITSVADDDVLIYDTATSQWLNTKIEHIAVKSVNGLTGAVQVTGSGAITQTVSGTTTTLGARLATTSVTGVASFNNVRFTATTTGHIDLAAAYQVTGQTVVAGNNISTTTSGNAVTINVTAGGSSNAIQFNSNGTLTGNSDFTYDPSNGEFKVNVADSSRFFTITPGAQSYIASNGNSELNIIGGNGGLNAVRLGDVDVLGNGTKLEISDGLVNITLNADNGFGSGTLEFNSGDAINCNANRTICSGGLSAAGWLTVGMGATFNSNVTIRGNASLGDAATDTTTIYGTKIVNEGVYVNGSLRTANISFANGQVQTLTGVGTGATGVTAIYFTGAPSTGAASVTMIITNGGLMSGTGMTAWGGNIKWPGGIKPVLSSSGIDVVSFVTPNAGTTIYGFVGGLNFT